MGLSSVVHVLLLLSCSHKQPKTVSLGVEVIRSKSPSVSPHKAQLNIEPLTRLRHCRDQSFHVPAHPLSS